MRKLLITAVFLCLAGCSATSINPSGMLKAGANAYRAATVDDTELKAMALKMRQQGDAEAQVAPANSKYTQRLNRLMAKLNNVNGVPLNYKVYMKDEINANASPDGSVRVYSGLMDKMNDDELRFVIGHEIGHVALGHSLNAMKLAYATEAARLGASALSPTAAAITNSQLGGIATVYVNAQFSQSQESDADAYGVKFLKDNHYDTAAAGSALRKIAAISRGGGFFDSHPDPAKRVLRADGLARSAN